MKIDLQREGAYVLAVSGGVDSVVLLDLLARKSQVPSPKSHSEKSKGKALRAKDSTRSRLVVAHFDHGIRKDSEHDRKFVQSLAEKYGLQFVYNIASLGPNAGEAAARKARYEFLFSVRRACAAEAIITAHHQDDRIETAFINLIRGTGRKGLTSIATTNDIVRPMLNYSKDDIISYAKKHDLKWQEDETNINTKFLRNNVRHNIVTKLNKTQRADFIKLLDRLQDVNNDIDALLINTIHAHSHRAGALHRKVVVAADFSESCELVAMWLRCNNVRNFDKKIIQNLVVGIKTLTSGSIDVGSQFQVRVNKQTLALVHRDR